jgi:hypothetical protein
MGDDTEFALVAGISMNSGASAHTLYPESCSEIVVVVA